MNVISQYVAPEVLLAREFGPDLETLNRDAETVCRVNDSAIELMKTQGFLSMMIPQIYGGTQRDLIDSLKVIEALSYSDSAIGWSAMIYSKTALLGSSLPSRWAREVYSVGHQDESPICPIVAGAAAPSGRGKKVDGGVIVSGRWAWGSGTHHADWICGGTIVEENGAVITLANGQPAVHVMFFKKEDMLLHDNWNPSGLRGTGSNDFEATEVFVPEGRWIVLGESDTHVDAPLYRFPFFGYFAVAVASVPLGIARRALDDFELINRSKRKIGKPGNSGSSPILQLEFGQAESLVAGARHFVWGAVTDVWNKIVSGGEATTEDKRQLRLAACQGTAMCAQAVDILYNTAGGTALQGDCSLQKHFRDIHAATQHRQVSSEILRMGAAVRLDEESAAQL